MIFNASNDHIIGTTPKPMNEVEMRSWAKRYMLHAMYKKV